MSHGRLLTDELDLNLPYQSSQIQQGYGNIEKDTEEDYQVRRAKRKKVSQIIPTDSMHHSCIHSFMPISV